MIDSAIILAVSAPTHSSQLTQQRPSAILPALGKPMVIRVMERLYRAGIRRYIMIIGLNEGAVASYLNKQWMPDAKIEFELKANETLQQIIGRVAQRLESPFMIAGYNSFTYERFSQTLIRQNEEFPDHLVLTGAQLTLSPEAKNYYAHMDGQIIRDVSTQAMDNPREGYVLAEFAICGHHFREYLTTFTNDSTTNKTFFEMVQQYSQQDDSQITLGETSWILRVESDADLLTLNKRLLEDSNDSHILSELPYTVKIIPPVRIDPQVSVGQGAVIGPHVYAERGSTIGYGATVKNSIILERGSVPHDKEVDGGIVTSRGIFYE